jgi:RsiW-degrading membrane proteinase PrsW (M82 family)
MGLLSALGLLLWHMQAQTSVVQLIMAWAFGALCLAGAALWAPRQTLASGAVLWNGQAWFWQSHSGEDHPLELSVGLDLGGALLLFVRLQNAQGQDHGPWRCAWLSQAVMPSKWHGFRCAVYSRPKTVFAPNATVDLRDR